jgi:hypothetical protein
MEFLSTPYISRVHSKQLCCTDSSKVINPLYPGAQDHECQPRPGNVGTKLKSLPCGLPEIFLVLALKVHIPEITSVLGKPVRVVTLVWKDTQDVKLHKGRAFVPFLTLSNEEQNRPPISISRLTEFMNVL